jgi:RimJ/RimL family protein N-acetyltransferase
MAVLIGHKVRLRRKKMSDARKDYRWQTDPELARLDAMPLLTVSYAQYLLDYSTALRFPAPSRRVFAIDTLEGRHIGNCVYYHIDEDRGEAEVGIMIGERDFWDRGYGTDAVIALVDHIFRETPLRRLHLKTLEWNDRAQRCFLKCGFNPCGSVNRNGYQFTLMELHREGWEKAQSRAEAGNVSA